MGRGLGQVLLASGATAGAAYGVSRVIGHAVSTATIPGQAVQVAGAVGAGVAVFLAAAWILRIEDLAVLRGLLPGRSRR